MRDRLLPDVVALTPSSLDAWLRCRRAYLIGDVLALPESDAGPSPEHGLLVHDLLRHLHRHGSCRDAAHVDDTLAAHGLDVSGPLRGFVDRHAHRCPTEVERAGHEVERARFHRLPAPMFMATGRIDALWVHDGLLDARDYKTGRPYVERVADDPRARLQAWLLEPVARRHRLRLRVRYEYLAPEVGDDPEPYEPAAAELADVEEELTGVVASMTAEVDFAGVAENGVCSRCVFRAVCRDSAAPGEPLWAMPAA